MQVFEAKRKLEIFTLNRVFAAEKLRKLVVQIAKRSFNKREHSKKANQLQESIVQVAGRLKV